VNSTTKHIVLRAWKQNWRSKK